ncbi:hypothetical protein M0804_010102 [Polistes exclamans]|nr:hypothetical protein M0804_010102 [Polistes exclamans]
MPPVKFDYKGLIAPVFTPFTPDGHLNLSVIPAYANYLHENGIKGVLVNGTTGEGMSMNIEERKEVAEAWSKAVTSTNQYLMIQVGGSNLPDVIHLAKHAQTIGADSILVLPELYFKPDCQLNLRNYLKTIAQEVPDMPMLYYHIPLYTNVTLDIGSFLDFIGNEIPSLVGVKFTHTDLVQASHILNARNGMFKIFLGCDQLISSGCVLGIDSFIVTSINLFPKHISKLVHANEFSDLPDIRKMQEKIISAIDAITTFGDWIQSMKIAMQIISPIDVGPPRLPLLPLPSKCYKWIEEALKDYRSLLK